MLIQLLLSFFAVAGFSLILRRHKQGILRPIETLGWSIVWSSVIIVVWMPSIADRVANLFGVGRGADIVLYVGVSVLSILVFQLFVSLDKLERKLTELVRAEALRDLPKPE